MLQTDLLSNEMALSLVAFELIQVSAGCLQPTSILRNNEMIGRLLSNRTSILIKELFLSECSMSAASVDFKEQ
jgi:hypothetical protein